MYSTNGKQRQKRGRDGDSMVYDEDPSDQHAPSLYMLVLKAEVLIFR